MAKTNMISEFMRGELDIQTLDDTERKNLLAGVREDYSKAQATITEQTQTISDLKTNVETLTEDKSTLEDSLATAEGRIKEYEELAEQRNKDQKESLLTQIEEHMTELGKELSEELKTKLSTQSIEALEVHLELMKGTEGSPRDLTQDEPDEKAKLAAAEEAKSKGVESDPKDAYEKEDDPKDKKQEVKTRFNAESFGKS